MDEYDLLRCVGSPRRSRSSFPRSAGGVRIATTTRSIPRSTIRPWPPLLISRPFDRDDLQNGLPVSGNFFGVDDYGFHHGAVWYRGHFTATGAERALVLDAIAGRGGACGAWLNGFYLGSVNGQ